MHSSKPQEFSHASFQGRIGIARVDITPPVGIYSRSWGAAKHDVADSIHRALTLTAMTLTTTSNDQPLVFVDAELGWWKMLETYRKFQARLLGELSIEPSNLIFALSHTHAGPQLMEADDPLPGGDVLRSWMETLVGSTIDAVRKSLNSQFEAILDWGVGKCNLATNRDLPDPNPDEERILCGYNPGGTPDDTLLVGRISDRTGQLRATLVNYACHPTTLAWDNTAISPDYVGAMRETIQQSTDAPSLFLLGACGDLAPRYQYVGDTEIADKHGRQLAHATLSTLYGMEPPGTALTFAETVESGAPLAVWKHEAYEPSQQLLAIQAYAELAVKDLPSSEGLKRQSCDDRTLEERIWRQRNVRRSIGDGPTYNLPIHIWKLGDAVLVGSCCEAYSLLQQELRSRFPDTTIVCMNLINGSLGYLPPRELYDKDVYQVWQSPFDRGCLEATLETMSHAIADVLANG